MPAKEVKVNTQVLSGFIEYLPHEQVVFDRLKQTIESTYHQFGFASLDTPVIERSEVLLAKGGEETDSLLFYTTNDPSLRDMKSKALRFDLTVPLARYVAAHMNDLVFPFRRCHIGRVYRGERAAKGRAREFYQCDIDVIGCGELSVRYDAEIPNIIYQLFKKLDLGKFTIHISNRKVFNGLLEGLNITAPQSAVLATVDKAEKISHEELLAAFVTLGLTATQMETLLACMRIKGKPDHALRELEALNIDNPLFTEGFNELKTVADILIQMDTDPDYFVIDLAIVRGLDYYTGTVYETLLDGLGFGSVCSGGRYDNLAGHYTTEKLPGVGISIGLTRLFEQLRENELLDLRGQSTADVVAVPDREQNLPLALRTAQALRAKDLNVDVLLEDTSTKKKYRYIDKKNAPYTLIVKTLPEGDEVISLQYKTDVGITKEQLPPGEVPARIQELKDTQS